MIGIIGGSGLEDPQILQDALEENVDNPYGRHSPIKIGKIGGIDVAVAVGSAACVCARSPATFATAVF